MGTISVRGAGGAEFDIDDPFEEPDTLQKEIHREQLDKHQLVRVGELLEDGDDSGGQDVVEEPARNGSTDEWKAYAIAQGATEDEVADLKRDELVEKYGTPSA